MAPCSIQIQLALILVLVAVAAPQSPIRPQIIRFFTSPNCPLGTLPRYEFEQSTNLSAQNYQSFCVIRGAWRVEVDPVRSEADYHIVHGDSCRLCINKNISSVNRKFGWVQRLGGHDLIYAQFNLYEEIDFRGREVQINGWEHTFTETLSFSSIAFTSFSNWTWQIFYKPRYQGSSYCYRADPKREVTLFERLSISVGSVRLGCNSGIRALAGGKVVAFTFILLRVLTCMYNRLI